MTSTNLGTKESKEPEKKVLISGYLLCMCVCACVCACVRMHKEINMENINE